MSDQFLTIWYIWRVCSDICSHTISILCMSTDRKTKQKLIRKIDLTHWGRVTHICVSKLAIIGSDNGLSPERRQDIIWTNAGILLIGPLGTNFSEILLKNSNIFIEENTFENVVCEMFFIPSRPQCFKEWQRDIRQTSNDTHTESLKPELWPAGESSQ